MAPPQRTLNHTLVGPLITETSKLSTDNFTEWKEYFDMIVQGVGADYLLAAVLPAAVPEEFTSMDSQLAPLLFLKMEPEVRNLISPDDRKSALKCWTSILAQFKQANWRRRFAARRAFLQIQHDPSRPISIFLAAVEKAASDLEGFGLKVGEDEKVDVILMNLDESFHPARTSILASSTKEPSLATLKATLIGSDEVAINVKSEPVDNALAVRGGYGRRGSGGGRASASGGGQVDYPVDNDGYRWCDPTNEGRCHRCGRSGHIAGHCMFRMPQHVIDWILKGARNSSSRDDDALQASAELESASLASAVWYESPEEFAACHPDGYSGDSLLPILLV